MKNSENKQLKRIKKNLTIKLMKNKERESKKLEDNWMRRKE